jgi:hypothetical protein
MSGVFPLYNNTKLDEILASMPDHNEWRIRSDWVAPGTTGPGARSLSFHASSSMTAEGGSDEEVDDTSRGEDVPSPPAS